MYRSSVDQQGGKQTICNHLEVFSCLLVLLSEKKQSVVEEEKKQDQGFSQGKK